jgi:hypothetical protein
MKVLGVIALLAIIFAVASNGPGVPALNPGNVNTNPFPVSDGNMPAASIGADGLNPPHGKPGHRCDISVGQPLNSTPTEAGKATNQLPVFGVPAVNPASGLNPPHGKPGHRCDLKVGEPLNSKPAQASTTTTPLLTAPAVTPKINPAHGQPGHRCGVKVGDPL